MFRRAYPQSVGVGSFWSGVTDFFNPHIKTSDFIKTNLWNWETQPDYTPVKPPGAVVPTGALNPATGYHPYAYDYTWCSPTDVVCLNRVTNQPDQNLADARQNMVNYAAAQQAAIVQAEREAAEKDKGLPDWAMYLAVAGLGVAGFMAISKGGRR
jgi:hypothetical protein